MPQTGSTKQIRQKISIPTGIGVGCGDVGYSIVVSIGCGYIKTAIVVRVGGDQIHRPIVVAVRCDQINRAVPVGIGTDHVNAAVVVGVHPHHIHLPVVINIPADDINPPMRLALAEHLPERSLACGLIALEVGPETAAVRDVPMLTLFGSKDGKQLPQLEALLPKRRAEFEASWAIAVQWGRGHEWGQANNLLGPFFDEVIRQRLPAAAAPASGPVQLRRYDPAHVWLAGPASWKSRTPTIAAAASCTADKAAACWLPGEEVARVWQSFVVDKPIVQITEPASQGDKKPLAIFTPGQTVAVQVQVHPAFAAQKILLFDRATRLGEAPVTTGKAELRIGPLPAGFHTLIAHAVNAEGAFELSRPATILVQLPVTNASSTSSK